MARIRVLLVAVLAFCLTVVGGVVAVTASAHTPNVTSNCDELVVDLKNYNTNSGPNHVKVTIDGDVVEDVDFATTYKETFDAPDKYKSYSYQVAVTASDDADATKGWTRTFEGSSQPCEKPESHTPVNVCHATNSDTNPYVFITVDDDSVKFRGHLMHRNQPNKTWKSDGVFRGKAVKAGDPKPDLIGDYTDKSGTLHTYDGVITSKTDCGILQPPPPQETDKGKLKIRKVLDGDPLGTDPTFTVQVDCPGTAYDQDVVLDQGNGYENVTGDIPTGTQCTLTETDTPDGWDIDGFLPDGGESVTVTVGTGTPATVSATVENDRRTGRVQITKVVKGEVVPGTEFTVHLDCPGEGYDEVAVLNEGNKWTSPLYVGIPSGIECTVTEPNVPAGWTLDSITWTIDEDNQSGTTGTFRIDSFATVEVTVTNSRPTTPPPPTTGVISVTKQLTGPVGDASTSFTFDVDCPGTTYDQSVVVAVTNGSSATGSTTQIPTGLTCTVSERSTPGWAQTSVVPAGGVVAVGSTVTFTNSRVTPPPPTGTVTKTSVPATGTVVAPGQKIDYTVTVRNTGQAAITGAPVVDTLPNHVTVVAGTVSDGGTTSADGRSITWTVTLPAGASKSLTYQGLVATGAPANASLVNKATFLLQESTTTHTVGTRGLGVVKAVSPGGTVEFGDELTYTLTVTATGNLPQTNVVVTDPVPAGTTLVNGSVGCDGTCTTAVANGVVTWGLGSMAAGTSRVVTFKVTVDTPAPDSDGAIPAVDIVNAGAAASNEVPTTPSNQVVTPVVAVERVKEGPTGPGADTPVEDVPAGPTDTGVLPRTGAGISSGMVGGIAGILLLMGIALMVVARPTVVRPER